MKQRRAPTRAEKGAVSYDAASAPTQTEYSALQHAYRFLAAKLFKGELPDVLITLQRHANARGFFKPDSFIARRAGGNRAHELALNPDHFEGRTDEQIVSTLAHEMAHVWQEVRGKPPRRCYHNREWADKMIAIGLHPSDTGEPGGKETGQHCSHYIIQDGPFQRAWKELAETGFKLNWQSPPELKEARAKKNASKTKFTCPNCEQNAWAKADSILICGVCFEDDETDPTIMEQEQ